MPQRPPYLSIALVSGAALAYEVLLMRLFSIIQWHHFSYMIIGLALLGYGFSGTVVAIFQRVLLAHFRVAYLACLVLFGVLSVTGFLLAQSLPFNAELMLWDYRQVIYLLVIFLLLSLPFFFAATAICLAFMYYQEQVPRIYAWDLAGAGAGSLAVIGLLFVFFAEHALLVISLLGLLAFLVASREMRNGNYASMAAVFLVSSATLGIVASNVELQMSPYKGLPQTLRISGTAVIEQDSSPFGLVNIVESTQVPFRHAPGLSLSSTEEPLPQLGVFTDGDNMTVITRAANDMSELRYLDQVSSALPYHLSSPRSVLVVGAGGGTDILQALYHEARHIDVIELNPQLIDIVGRRYSQYNGGLFQRDEVNVYAGDVRGYLSQTGRRYDLIQISLMDAFNASASGLYALNEDYLYTIEALAQYIEHLNPGGYLVLTRWVKIPPRDTLKLFASAVDALKQAGVADPAAHLAQLRSWQTSTLLIKNGKITTEELMAISDFSDARSFDIDYAAGKPVPKQRYNQLAEEWFKEGIGSLMSDQRDEYLNSYKFDLTPATDDRPYFHHFTKWSSLPEIFSLRDRGGMPLIEWGYVVLMLTLLVAAVLSVVLIALPLFFLPRVAVEDKGRVGRTRVMLYFLAIGIAFLFMEIAFMQKFILFLHHPLYSFAVTLSVFLVFAGLGSYFTARLSATMSRQRILLISISGIVVIGLAYILLLGDLFSWLSAIPLLSKIVVTILLIAPLALLMGMPFPLALSVLSSHARELVPWAWGINGCASVISASLATLLAIHFGFSAVIVIAICLYLAVVFLYPRVVNV